MGHRLRQKNAPAAKNNLAGPRGLAVWARGRPSTQDRSPPWDVAAAFSTGRSSLVSPRRRRTMQGAVDGSTVHLLPHRTKRLRVSGKASALAVAGCQGIRPQLIAAHQPRLAAKPSGS